jgi:hypothetical protein
MRQLTPNQRLTLPKTHYLKKKHFLRKLMDNILFGVPILTSGAQPHMMRLRPRAPDRKMTQLLLRLRLRSTQYKNMSVHTIYCILYKFYISVYRNNGTISSEYTHKVSVDLSKSYYYPFNSATWWYSIHICSMLQKFNSSKLHFRLLYVREAYTCVPNDITTSMDGNYV